MARRRERKDPLAPEGAYYGGSAKLPPVPQRHIWTTQEEYDAQIAMPLHFEAKGISVDEDGHPFHSTLCGLRLGEVLLRSTGAKKNVNCAKCKAKL